MAWSRRHYFLMLGAGIIILCGYFLELKPALLQLNSLRQTANTKQKNLGSVRTQFEKRITQSGSSSGRDYTDKNGVFISALIALAESSGLSVESALHLNSDNRLQLKMLGSYNGLLIFVHELRLQKAIVYIEDFEIKLLHNGQLRMTLDVIASMPIATEQPINFINDRATYSQAPFCHPSDRLIAQSIDMSKVAYRYSIEQMKMLGFLHTSKHAYALLALPDGNAIQATVGDDIGLEHAIVRVILPGKLQLNVKNNKYIIKMDNAG